MNRKKIFIAIALALGGLLVFRLYQQLGAQADARPAGKGGGPRAQLVEVAVADYSNIRERVSLVGSLQAKHRVEVTPKFSGRVVEVLVDRGDSVKTGQVVARLEDDELQQQVRRAEASLQVARASMAQRQAELESIEMEHGRYRRLEEEGIVSSEESQQAQTRVAVTRAQLGVTQAQVGQAEAELEELRIRLSQTAILSPLTGMVGTRYVDAGALVTTNTPILLILNLASMVTEVNVPERDINKIQVGNTARVTVDALPGEDLSGRVLRVSPILDPQTRTAPVEIELPNTTGRLKAQMFARVDLNLLTEREALLVPRDALVYRSNRPGVFVVESDVARFQSIETGLTEADQIEVRSGLSKGATVVSRGANLLKNGDSVQVQHP